MQRARRAAVFAALALAGALALTGCRAEPGVALYVGDTRYTQQQVDGLAEQLATIPGIGTADSRKQVIQWVVARDVGKRIVADQKWPEPRVDTQESSGRFAEAVQQGIQQEEAAKLGNNPTNEQVGKAEEEITRRVTDRMSTLAPLVQLYAEFQAYIALAQQRSTAAQPTEQDYADLYRRAQQAGLVEPSMTVADYRSQLGEQNEQIFAANIGLRNLYADAIKRANVTVNPRYAPAELALLSDNQRNPLVVIPLNAKAVRGASPAAGDR